MARFRKVRPELNAIVYTMFSDAEKIKRCITSRVQGYVTKSSSVEELFRGLKAVAFGGSYFCKEAMDVLSKATALSEEKGYRPNIFSLYKKLSPKEKEVFILTAKGYSVGEISKETNKKETTIKNQRTAVYQKLDCADRHELFLAAQELGLV